MDSRTERCKQEYEGKHYFTKNKEREFIITNYDAASSVDIEFIDSGYKKHTNMGNINMGLSDPFKGNSPIAFEDSIKALIGCYFKTKQGYLIRIIGGSTLKQMQYQFQDEFGYIGCTTIQNIRKGEIRNPYHKNEFGGYLGEGSFKGNDYVYNIWHSLIVRGTGAKSKYSYYRDSQLYQDCKICNEWLNYNIFAQWYTSNISKLNPNYSYEIDKDLLYPLYKNQSGGWKLYSPTTVVLIPHDLNLLLFNTKIENRYNQVLKTAEIYYKDNAISQKTYNAILSIYGDRHKTYIDFRRNNYNTNSYRIN